MQSGSSPQMRTARSLRLGLLGALLVLLLPLAPTAAHADTPTPAPSPTATTPGTPASQAPALWAVTLGSTNLYAAPDDGSDVFGVVRADFPLEVRSYAGDWALVYNPRTRGTAYVHSDALGPGDPPSPYLLKTPPPIEDTLEMQGLVISDTQFDWYPTSDDAAASEPVSQGTSVDVAGAVTGDDGQRWYVTDEGDYISSQNVFLPDAPTLFPGRWIDADLTTPTTVVAYEGGTPVRSMLAVRGTGPFPTPTGTFTILRRVADETMDSATVGIPRNSPNGYYLTGVLWTQYFTNDGASFHYNYWSSNFGYPGSHGCLGLSYDDSKFLWDWDAVGTPVTVHY